MWWFYSSVRIFLARCFSFFFNDTATTEIYTLSLHDALPIFLKAYVEGTDNNKRQDDAETPLPDLVQGDPVSAASLTPQGHETKPPARYTEATLIKELEEREIGRPSTYASIIGT